MAEEAARTPSLSEAWIDMSRVSAAAAITEETARQRADHSRALIQRLSQDQTSMSNRQRPTQAATNRPCTKNLGQLPAVGKSINGGGSPIGG
jgi:hypothetical protein